MSSTNDSRNIDLHSHSTASDGALTARELRLAEVFAAHPGVILTRDALLNAVWGVDYFGTTRTLDQHVAQLRKKVGGPADATSPIATVHGIGYRLEVDSTDARAGWFDPAGNDCDPGACFSSG